MRRSASARTESSRRAPTIARIVDAQCIVQMRPSTRRITTTKRTSPTPPVGAYPQSRLCGHRGSAPHSAKIKITINMVPSIFAPYSKESGANPKMDPRRSEFPPNCSLCRGSPVEALHRDTDRNSGARISAVTQVIAAIGVSEINIVGGCPNRSPSIPVMDQPQQHVERSAWQQHRARNWLGMPPFGLAWFCFTPGCSCWA